MLIVLAAMIRKDLQLFFSDRRAVVMGFVAPIAIASFFGSIFSGPGTTEAARIPVAIVNEDGGAVSAAIVAGARGNRSLDVTTPTSGEARAAVQAGRVGVAVIIPPGFGDAAGRAFLAGAEQPVMRMLYDPSRGAELAMVRGMLTQHVMESVSREMFTGASGRAVVDEALAGIDRMGLPAEQRESLRTLLESARRLNEGSAGGGAPRGINMPYTVAEEAVTSGENVAYNGYAHAFAGMGIQFLLFAMIDLGVGILLEQQRGLWKRLRSAPVSRFVLLAGKAASGTLIALMSLLVSFGFAMAVFGVRIQGSVIGFGAVALACAVMAATFGLLIAAIGRTPGGTRGFAILAVLMMVMLGGAWVPTFIFPAWLQRLTVVVPARWAVDGLDAMTWRGLGLESAVVPVAVLLGFAAIFGALAAARFRWDAA
jgi:ABC-2 type transport system permease protein